MNINFEQQAPKWAETLNLRKAGVAEYSGPCPSCGGKDRFWINSHNGELRHHCRQGCDFQTRHKEIAAIGLIPDVLDPAKTHAIHNESAIPYHLRKRIELEGSGATCDGGTLSVDLFDLRTGVWRGKQLIAPDGSKKFTPNLKKECTGAFIGEKTNRIFVTEGWADAVIVHQATGDQAFFALDANTLPNSAKQLAQLGYDVVVAADSDQIGVTAAKAAGLPYVVPQGFKDFWELFDAKGLDAVREQLTKRADPNAFALFDHVLDIDLSPPKWLIEDMLPEYSMAAIVGPSYSGKSFLAVDIACSVATGTPFHGRAIEQGSVFYVVGEGRHGIRRRVEAFCRDRGVTMTRETAPLHFSKQGLNFRDPASVNAIRDDLRKVKDVKLIIIDTLARSFGGGNENAPQDMGEFINGCDDLMHGFGATVLVVHHTGKDSTAGARGHSSLFGALDTSLTVKKISQHDMLVHCEKQKDAQEFDDMQFCFVTLSGDDDTPVLHQLETTSHPMKLKLGINEQLAMDTYMEATKGRPIQCRLHLDEWRPHFEKRHTGDTSKQKNDAFSRARRTLVSRGLMTANNDFYMLSDKATSGVIQENVARQNASAGDATDTPL